eukprot:TRINITY_DN4512_c0_g1_i5.p1 TRINITY_DN4512_c0_g1~~TRINITY_DN4512_c0_g1_i5.p1  ORF type:complete len:256 (+),score=36.16 TRINITY_DN4512_c0_g1_i5:335-1102(+)
MAKDTSTLLNSSHLFLYEESYGSKAVFAVSCPSTDYWQNTITSVVSELVNEYGTDGVYLDQIAAAGPRNCFDPTHDHPLGGGSAWVDGYRLMLTKARSKIGNDAILLTESNAEPFMDSINLYLTLVGFIVADFSGSNRIIPVFPAIYGGSQMIPIRWGPVWWCPLNLTTEESISSSFCLHTCWWLDVLPNWPPYSNLTGLGGQRTNPNTRPFPPSEFVMSDNPVPSCLAHCYVISIHIHQFPTIARELPVELFDP